MSDEIKDGATDANETVGTVETDIAQPRETEADGLAAAIKSLGEVVSAATGRKNSDGFLSEDREKIERAHAEVASLRKQLDEIQNSRTMRRAEFEVSSTKATPYNRAQFKALMKADAAPGSDVEQIQRANDEMYIGMKLLGVNDPNHAPALKQYISEMYPAYAKGMGTGDAGSGEVLGTGSNNDGEQWIPNDFSNQLVRDIRMQLRVAALHPRFNMPTNPYTFPVEGSDIDAYLVSEQTADNAELTPGNRVTAQTPGTGNLTFSAKKLGVRSVVSTEVTEDSIVPIIPYVREKIARAMAEAQEEATVNGDTRTTVANIDGLTAGTESDRRHAYNGYRYAAIQAGTTSDASGGLTLAKVRKLRTDMGKWGIDVSQLAYVVGINAYNQLLGLNEVVTLDKFGPRATIFNGQLGSLDGIPIIVSEHVSETLDADGLNSGTGSATEILLVRRDAFRYGDRRQITMEAMRRIETDQQVMVSLQRLDFKPMYTPSATNTIVAAGVGITLA